MLPAHRMPRQQFAVLSILGLLLLVIILDTSTTVYQSTQSGWYTVVLVSLDGQQLVSTRVPWGAPLRNVVEPESFRRLLETRKPTVGIMRPPLDGGAEFVFPIRVPVFRDGELKYALSAVVNAASAASQYSST